MTPNIHPLRAGSRACGDRGRVWRRRLWRFAGSNSRMARAMAVHLCGLGDQVGPQSPQATATVRPTRRLYLRNNR